MPIKRTRKRNNIARLSYRETLCKMIGSGFFNIFRRILPNKRIYINMQDMVNYKCDKLDGKWPSFTSGAQPDYAFFEDNSNIVRLKKMGLIIDDARKQVDKCEDKRITEFNKAGTNSRTSIINRERQNQKTYKYVYTTNKNRATSTSSYNNRPGKSTTLPTILSSCNSDYKRMELASIRYIIELMKIIKSIVEKCKKLKFPTKDVSALKCIIALFNNADLLNVLFGNSSSSSELRLSSSSSTKETLDKTLIGKGTPVETVYTILRGKSNSSSSDYYGSSSSSSTTALADVDMEMYFNPKDPVKRQNYLKLLDEVLLKKYIEPAILQLDVELTIVEKY
jgi:hypothetical protein